MKTKQKNLKPKNLKPAVAYSLIIGAFIISLSAIYYFYNKQVIILNNSVDFPIDNFERPQRLAPRN